jgi:hypothetical protein
VMESTTTPATSPVNNLVRFEYVIMAKNTNI